MFDPLSKHKNKVAQAKVHLALSEKYQARRISEAKNKTERLISSPKGLGGAFALGCFASVTVDKKPPASSILSSLIKFML